MNENMLIICIVDYNNGQIVEFEDCLIYWPEKKQFEPESLDISERNYGLFGQECAKENVQKAAKKNDNYV